MPKKVYQMLMCSTFYVRYWLLQNKLNKRNKSVATFFQVSLMFAGKAMSRPIEWDGAVTDK